MASAYANLLTEEEKWQFDLRGDLHLKEVIKPDRLVGMLEVINHCLTVDAAEKCQSRYVATARSRIRRIWNIFSTTQPVPTV